VAGIVVRLAFDSENRPHQSRAVRATAEELVTEFDEKRLRRNGQDEVHAGSTLIFRKIKTQCDRRGRDAEIPVIASVRKRLAADLDLPCRSLYTCRLIAPTEPSKASREALVWVNLAAPP
jgi:hypothetical protein